jgi:hypothetical protein
MFYNSYILSCALSLLLVLGVVLGGIGANLLKNSISLNNRNGLSDATYGLIFLNKGIFILVGIWAYLYVYLK